MADLRGDSRLSALGKAAIHLLNVYSHQWRGGDGRSEGFPLVRRANIWRAARPQWNPKRPFSEQNTFPKNGRITLEADIAAALLRLAKI